MAELRGMSGHTPGPWTESIVTTANPPRELMRLARRTEGTIEKARTHYDHEREGRVLELVVFWPGQAGYDEVQDGGSGRKAAP